MIIGGVVILAITMTVAFNLNISTQKNNGSSLSLANVEALAQENPEGSGRTWQKGEKTITNEVYTTTSAGWTWSLELNIWKFKGSVTSNWPPNYLKATETVKINCCREQGNLTECEYESC